MLIKHSSSNGKSVGSINDVSPFELLNQSSFRKILQVEEKRTERSGRRFVLMLLECTGLLSCGKCQDSLDEILRVLSKSIRETDITGWYEQHSTVGIIFTEIGPAEGHAVTKALLNKVSSVLSTVLNIEDLRQIRISFHVFPEKWTAMAQMAPAGYSTPKRMLGTALKRLRAA